MTVPLRATSGEWQIALITFAQSATGRAQTYVAVSETFTVLRPVVEGP